MRPPETLDEFLERHRRLAAEKGLPPKVQDPEVLERIAGIWQSVLEREAEAAQLRRGRRRRRRDSP